MHSPILSILGFACRAIALVSAPALLIACSAEAPSERRAEAPRPVTSFTVEARENVRVIEAVGTARARAAATVQAETAGIVEDVVFRPGAAVEKGDVLIRLEADDERLAADLARVAVREAEQLLERYLRIEDTGAVSDSAIDEARTQLDAAKIQLEQAKVRLEDRTLRAPFSGYAGLTDLDPGARIAPGDPVTTIDDRRVIYIDFTAPEDVFGQLGVGDSVRAEPFAAAAQTVDAEVVFLGARVDPASRAFSARAAVENLGDTLRPGMSFKVSFSVPGRAYPAVPEASIVWGSDGAYVWAIEDGAAVRAPVSIVSRQSSTVLVDGALEPGAIIVAEGVQKVRDGTEVTLVSRRKSDATEIVRNEDAVRVRG